MNEQKNFSSKTPNANKLKFDFKNEEFLTNKNNTNTIHIESTIVKSHSKTKELAYENKEKKLAKNPILQYESCKIEPKIDKLCYNLEKNYDNKSNNNYYSEVDKNSNYNRPIKPQGVFYFFNFLTFNFGFFFVFK